MLEFDAANDMAEPTVSISPFIPVNTGTAPDEQFSVIQSCKPSRSLGCAVDGLVNVIPLELSLVLHMNQLNLLL